MGRDDTTPAQERLYWRGVLDALPQCVGIYSAVRDTRGQIVDFRVEYVNDAACENNCLSRDEQVGKRLNDLLPAHRETGLFGAYCAVVDTGRPVIRKCFEYRDIYGQRVETREFDIHVCKFGDGFVASWERCQREPAPADARSGEALRRAVEGSPVSLYECDADLRYRWVMNPMEGCSSEDIVGRRDDELLPEREARALMQFKREAIRRGEAMRRRFDSKAGGCARRFDVSAKPLVDQHGETIGLCVASTDVTAILDAEEAIRQSEERLRRLIDTDVMSVAIIDRETGTYIDCNNAFLRLTGRSRTEISRGEVHRLNLMSPEQRNLAHHQLEELDRTGRVAPQEREVVGRDGARRWVLFAAAALGDGTAAEYAIDLEQQKRVEAELERARGELEDRVAERTTELRVQAQCLRRLAGELARAEHRERKRLASLLHDELQQLLAAASIRLESAQTRVTDDRARSALDKCRELLTEAIEASRDLSQQLRPPVLYEEGLAPALRWLASETQARHRLRVRVETENEPHTLPSETGALLFSAARELLFNVVKHAEASEATLRLFRRDGRAVLRVEDGGRGFDPSLINDDDKASGLGLFSIREQLAALDGELRIKSRPGEGARFELVVPCDALDTSESDAAHDDRS